MSEKSIKTARYPADCVTRLSHISSGAMRHLLDQYGIELKQTQCREIPGSYWGDEEAGLIGNRLYARPDTPVHSVLHESCHYICMPRSRRGDLHTNAGGDYNEENAVCYLQILLAGHLPGYDRARMLADMDAWGYTFRLGCASAWFNEDADDARSWLIHHAILNDDGKPTWQLRGQLRGSE